jgi:hypothetical protein
LTEIRKVVGGIRGDSELKAGSLGLYTIYSEKVGASLQNLDTVSPIADGGLKSCDGFLSAWGFYRYQNDDQGSLLPSTNLPSSKVADLMIA